MTSFSPEPEFWVEDGPDSGFDDGWGDWDGAGDSGGDSGGPGGPPGPDGTGGGPRRRWLRWAALATGLVVIAGLIVWQSRTGNNLEASDRTTTQTPSFTTPSTWAPTATGPAAPPDSTEADSTPTGARGPTHIVVVDPETGTGTESHPGVIASVAMTGDELVLPHAEGWQLQGYRRPLRPAGYLETGGLATLIRYDPAAGALSGITLPGLKTTGAVSFVVTGGSAILRPQDPVAGYVVSPAGEASEAAGELASPNATYLYPGPGQGQVWVANLSSVPATIRLADVTGRFLGAEFSPPDPPGPWGWYGAGPDGNGYLTIPAISGTYLLQPYGDGFQRVTTGVVLAAGPTGFLTYDCDAAARCGTYYVHRDTGTAVQIPVDYVPRNGMLPSGVISPDGTVAALADWGGSGAVVYLLDLATGDKTYPNVSLTDSFQVGDTVLYAFSPDGRYLMVAGADGIVPVEVATATALPALKTGPVDALAIEPVR